MEQPTPDLGIPIGGVVRRWRAVYHWSLTEYAERAGLRKGYVSEVEHGKIARPSDARLAKLAAPFGLTAWDLIRRRMPAEEDTDRHSGTPDAPIEDQGANHMHPSPIPGSASGRRPFRFGAGFPMPPLCSPDDLNDVVDEALKRIGELEHASTELRALLEDLRGINTTEHR